MTEKEKTTPVVSVGADTEQSLNVCNDSKPILMRMARA